MEFRNIKDFFDDYVANGGKRRDLYLEVRKETGVSMMTAERWFKMYVSTNNDQFLKVLEKITGISRTNLFRSHE